MSRAFASFRPEMQQRQVVARSLTLVGADESKRLTLSARVRMPERTQPSARHVDLLFELPGAEQRLRTSLLPSGFEDRSGAPFLGFALALLPSLLLDPLPKRKLGVGAAWQVEVRFTDAASEVISARRYRLSEWHDAHALGLTQQAPVALLTCEWRDGVAEGPEQLTTGQLWHSAAWLYPVGRLRQKTSDGRVSIETTLLIDHPEWPKLSQLMDRQAKPE